MIKKCLEAYARAVCSVPETIKIEVQRRENGAREVFMSVEKEDGGRLIGRDGCVINALKMLIGGSPAHENPNFKITIKTYDD